jgi:hypothetical protein
VLHRIAVQGRPGSSALPCLVVAAALACVLSVALPPGACAGAAAGPVPKLTALHFPVHFVPVQLTAAAGRVWVLGSGSPGTFADCGLEEITPSTMATRLFAIPDCPVDIASVDGEVDMITSAFVPGTAATRQLHLEVFDPPTGHTQVLAPTVLTDVGSNIAHTALAAGAGALWLYAYQVSAGPQVERIAPQTGAVTATITDPPAIGGLYPAVAADSAGEWLGGGPGGGPELAWARTGGPTTAVVSGPNRSAVLWVSAVGTRVWAGVADYGSGARPSVSDHLVAVNEQGHVVLTSRAETTGDYPLVSTPGGHLWSMSWAGTCGAAYRLVEVDAATGTSRAVATLKAAAQACNDADTGTQVTAIGRDVFALIPAGADGQSVLYRAET